MFKGFGRVYLFPALAVLLGSDTPVVYHHAQLMWNYHGVRTFNPSTQKASWNACANMLQTLASDLDCGPYDPHTHLTA